MKPHLVLGVPVNADDAAIRRAYLEAIKQATPETNPERFKAVAAAYDHIKDAASRRRHELTDTQTPGESPVDAFLRHLHVAPRPGPMSRESLLEYLRLCSKT